MNWQTMTFDEAGIILIDCVHKTPAARLQGYPYVAIPQMSGGHIRFEDARLIDSEDYVTWTQKARPREHDVILSRRTNPGVTAVDRTGTDFALGQNLVLLRSISDVVYPPFLRWICQSPGWWSQIDKYINEGAVFSSLRCGDVPKFEVIVPPQDVQVEIASTLDALDDKIELNRRMSATLEELTRSLYRSWFVDFDPVHARADGRLPAFMDEDTAALFPDRFGNDGLPLGWMRGSLSDIATNPRTGVKPDQVDPTTPYIGLEHMPKRCITLSDWGTAEDIGSQKSAMQQGDFLFGKLRPYFHKVGISPVSGICSTDIIVVRPAKPLWAAYTLSIISSDDFVEHTNAGSSGTRMPRTNWKDMGSYETVIPTEEVAQAFEKMLAPTRARIIEGVHEAKTLAALRDSLLPKLMSGELRVGEAQEQVDEVA